MQKLSYRKLQKGFTLIELLVVIAIIGLLASIVLVSLRAPAGKARDAKRISELRQIQTQIELYNQNCGFYPGYSTGAAAMVYGASLPATANVTGRVNSVFLDTASLKLSGDCTGNNAGFTIGTPGSTMISNLPAAPSADLQTSGTSCEHADEYRYAYYAASGTSYQLLTCLSATNANVTVTATNPATNAPRVMYDQNGGLFYWQ